MVHQGCASAGTDARICSTVRARVKCVIDRRERRTVCKAKEGVCSTVMEERE